MILDATVRDAVNECVELLLGECESGLDLPMDGLPKKVFDLYLGK